ncbi:hypothetical protein BDW72DRAFT_2587 [Aspergillus terricola var. indicus]
MMPGAVQIPTCTIMYTDHFGSNLRSLSASLQPRLMENVLVIQRSLASAVDLQCMNGGAGPVCPGHMGYYRFRHLLRYLSGIWLRSSRVLDALWFPNPPHSPGFLHLPVGLARLTSGDLHSSTRWVGTGMVGDGAYLNSH